MVLGRVTHGTPYIDQNTGQAFFDLEYSTMSNPPGTTKGSFKIADPPNYDPTDTYGGGVSTLFDIAAYWVVNVAAGAVGQGPATSDTIVVIGPDSFALYTVP